jgi:hypothetical protein
MPVVEAPRLSGMLRTFSTGYGQGGLDVEKQILQRNALAAARLKQKHSLQAHSQSLDVSWSYFNENVTSMWYCCTSRNVVTHE